MPIEMPPFSKIYKQREGADKFFYDKIKEVVDTVNALTAGETSTVSVSVLDDNGNGVEGVKVLLTSGDSSYSTGDTGKAGGASIQNVPYGVYNVSLSIPEGYSLLAKYDDVIVNSDNTKVQLTVNKNEDNLGSVNVSVKNTSGDIISGAEVVLSNDNDEITGYTDDKGVCTISNLPYGEYNYIVYAEDYLDDMGDITLSSKTLSLDVVMEVDE